MTDFAVVGVVGLQGSGKTEIAKIAAKLDIPCIRMGDVVWEECKRRGLDVNEANIGAVANELRQKEGLSAIAKRCVPLIEKSGEDKKAVFVDGIRGIAEVEEFRNAFKERFSVLAVWAGQRTRYRRIAARGREDDAASQQAFHEKDFRELSWGLGDALALADFVIVNEGTLTDLYSKSSELLNLLLGGKA